MAGLQDLFDLGAALEERLGDFESWAQLPRWSIQDAELLIAGVNPLPFRGIIYSRRIPQSIAVFTSQFRNAIAHGILKVSQDGFAIGLVPREVLLWASQNGIQVPKGLKIAVENYHTFVEALKASEEVSKGRRGRKPGDGLIDDSVHVEEIHKIKTAKPSLSLNAAVNIYLADSADKCDGHSLESKVRRLTKKYNEKYPRIY
jgi:hypothetical protein